ncbi:transglycosylase domain-containing protein [Nonomuraea dietziae]|uniref:transglycosylase domain-containing protein n=1 Tax=Nonomuraea dietziae TaxID=65515 RepID=UPI00360951E1
MAGMVVVAAGVFAMIWVGYANTPLPTAAQVEATAQESIIYYNDGKTEIARWGTPRRNVDISDINDAVKDATVAIENKTFYEDAGISLSGMARSVWSTATGQQLQGASTITQQMARNYYQGLSQEQTIERKIKEIFVAVKLNKELSKEQILQNYLNTVNFGRAYGIEAAAEAYFGKGKKASNVTPAEAAYLAARIQQPNWEINDPRLKHRWKTVIDYMAQQFPQKYASLPTTAKYPGRCRQQEERARRGQGIHGRGGPGGAEGEVPDLQRRGRAQWLQDHHDVRQKAHEGRQGRGRGRPEENVQGVPRGSGRR